MQFNNTVVRGSVKVKKCDAEAGCTTQGNSSLQGITFELRNASGRNIYYGGSAYANNAVITSGTTNSSGELTFSNLPVGTYTVKETATNTSYVLGGESKNVTVSSNSTAEVQFNNTVVRGSIKVKKCDAEAGCTTQGGSSLKGITFELKNVSGRNIYYGGNAYANNAVITSGTTGDNGELTFSNLPVGTYAVRETATNASYVLGGESKNVTVSSSSTAEVQFNNTVVKGNLTASNKDVEANSCATQGKATLAGTQFTVYNKTGKPIIYGGRSYANNAAIDTKTVNSSCQATFSGLPYGNYSVKETSIGTNSGYIINNTEETFSITTNGETISKSFPNQVIRADVKFRKMNDETNAPMISIPFRITSKTTGESHIVVTNGDGIINTSNSFIAHSTNTNGYDSASDIYTINYSGYGAWFGRIRGTTNTVAVNNSLGGLPYDDYEIVELDCSRNEYCYRLANPTPFTIDGSAVVKDLGDWTNDCVTHELDTVATDNADGDKYVEATSNVTIKDVITYRAMKGKTYTIRGVVMDKSTGQPLQINGSTVENSVTISPTTSEYGETTMTFTFNASDIAGKRLVVFERMYDNENNLLVVEHTDINDDDQSINVVYMDTTASDNNDGDKYIERAEGVQIKDIVDYCARNGRTYRLRGVLMDKSTNQPLSIDGDTVEQELVVPDNSNCGRTEMVFTIDAREIAGKDIVVFESLYEGDNLVTKHEDINDGNQGINVVSLDTTATDDVDGDKYIENTTDVRIRDFVDYCAKADTNYTLVGILMDKATGEVLPVEGNMVTREFTAENNCGDETLVFTIDASELKGTDIVVFERLFETAKYDPTGEMDETGTNGLVTLHTDINDESQNVNVISIDTTASDNIDGDKYVENTTDVEIKDLVDYCLKADRTYTIKGVIMDKSTDAPLGIDGDTVVQEFIVGDESNCGQEEMVFTFDASEIAGKDLVVFETIYEGGNSEDPDDSENPGHLVIKHEDINDENQSMNVVSIDAVSRDYEDGDEYIKNDPEVKIRDTVDYCMKDGHTYTIKGVIVDKTTGEPLDIEGNTVVKEFTVDNPENCGEVELVFPIDASDLKGVDIEIYETIYEDGNPEDPDDPDNPGHPVIRLEDINDEDQHITFVSLDTTASDNWDDDDYVKNTEKAQIKDVIDYCARANVHFAIKGIVMDKLTGEPLIIDGSTVEEIIDFTDEENCGQRTMTFTFDAREIAGRELVIFERLYEVKDEEEGDEDQQSEQDDEGEQKGDEEEDRYHLVIEHTDINDDSQTITIVSLDTISLDKLDEDKFIEVSKTSVIKDLVHYCVTPNTDFKITGYLADADTDEALSFNHKPIAKEVIVSSETGCGDIEMEYEFDSTRLAGHKIVVYNNLYIKHHKVLAHESPYDENQFVSIISFFTYAQNYNDRTKMLSIDSGNRIEDKIYYCLQPGERYIIKGTLMDKKTGKEILVNGEPVTESYELVVNKRKPCGELAMTYPIDTTELGGVEIVVFDEIYHDDELILAHRSFDDWDEMMSVMLPIPDTGENAGVLEAASKDDSHIIYTTIIMSVLGIAGYITKRIFTKKKSFYF